MTISITGTATDGEKTYSVSGYISEWEGGKSISLSLAPVPVAAPEPAPAIEESAAEEGS